jgi:hypothetical protein
MILLALSNVNLFLREPLDALPDTEANRERRVSLLVNQLLVFEQLIQMPEYFDLLTRYECVGTQMGHPGLMGAFYARLARVS